MMRKILLTSYRSPAEAYDLLLALRDLQDALWENYREDIRQWLQDDTIEDHSDIARFEDDDLPF